MNRRKNKGGPELPPVGGYTHCKSCGRPLTDKESRRLGRGPECRKDYVSSESWEEWARTHPRIATPKERQTLLSRSKKRKRRREDNHTSRQKVGAKQNARAIEDDVRLEAVERGLKLIVTECQGRRQTFQHWMFEARDGTRLLDYWPSTGSVYYRSADMKDKAESPWQALDFATFEALERNQRSKP